MIIHVCIVYIYSIYLYIGIWIGMDMYGYARRFCKPKLDRQVVWKYEVNIMKLSSSKHVSIFFGVAVYIYMIMYVYINNHVDPDVCGW